MPLTKILFVGDVHATPGDLNECQSLIDYILKTTKEQNVNKVVFLGDQYNTHEVMRVEVLNFWKDAFKQLTDTGLRVTALVGNHDQAGPGNTVTKHAMAAHSEQVRVIEGPTSDYEEGILYIPYTEDNERFVAYCKESECTTVVCHATFQGSRFENGFYAPDGVKVDDVPQNLIVSGHIHSPQTIGKVRYVGAPRWRTVADASVLERSLSLMTISDGAILDEKLFLTNGVVKRIIELRDTATKPLDCSQFNDFDEYRVDIHGTKEHYLQRKTEISGRNVKTRFVKESATSNMKVKESDGISVAFNKFIANFKPKNGTPKEDLYAMCQERLKCLQVGTN